MTEQEKREKVIKELGSCVEYFANKVKGVMFDEWLEESRKAIALLKAQEPRVMTLEEALRSSQKIGVPCWVEDHIEGIGVVLFPAVVTSDDIYIRYTGNDYYEGAIYHWAYNKRLRYWTAKPTDEQRKAVKWD